MIEFVKEKHSYIPDSLSMVLPSQLQRTAKRIVIKRIAISAPIQTGPGAFPVSYTMGTVLFPSGKEAHA